MAKRFLALFVLIFSVVKANADVKSNANQKNEEVRSSLERVSSNCQDSEPFFIKNRSRKAKKPYLTVDLATNAVNGGRKTGEANQQWMWRDCGKDGDGNLVNIATGLCLTKKGKGGMVAECEETKFWFWYEVDGTLENERFEWARLVKQKSALQLVTEMKYLKGTDTPWDWFRWDIEYVEAPKTAPYKLQPEDPGCYESDCPPGCQLVLIAKLLTPFGGLYYGIPAKESHIAVSPNTRLYKSTGQTAMGTWGDWALTYYMFHHRELNMWVIAEGEDALTSLGSEKILAQSGLSGSSVIPMTENGIYSVQWTWEDIYPYCMDMNSNKCKYDGYKPDETSRSLMHKSYPFSENEDGQVVTQFTYKGETYEVSQRTDSEGALIYATRGLPLDLPIMGRTNLGDPNALPRQYRVFSFSEENGFTDVEDFDPSLAVTDRVNDNNRHIQAASISTGIKIPSSSGLPWWSDSGKANSWELQMDITVTHSTNGTYFMTVGWGPGGYSGIQQTPSTRYVPSGKNFLFSMWDTNTDNHGNAEGGTPSYSYVDKLNEEADVGGKIGVINRKFGGEGTGQQIQIDYPWAIGDTTTAFIRGFRTSVGGEEWCVSSGLRAPGREEVFLARFCRKSPEDVLKGWGFYVFIEDWIGWPSCPATGFEVGFMKQRAAIFSNWKVTVDGKEVETAAPDFRTNLHGYARGLTDAGMLGDNAFYVSTGGWKYDNPYNP